MPVPDIGATLHEVQETSLSRYHNCCTKHGAAMATQPAAKLQDIGPSSFRRMLLAAEVGGQKGHPPPFLP